MHTLMIQSEHGHAHLPLLTACLPTTHLGDTCPDLTKHAVEGCVLSPCVAIENKHAAEVGVLGAFDACACIPHARTHLQDLAQI